MHHGRDPIDLPCACTTLRKTARAVSRLYDEALSGSGLTTTQFAILRSLNRDGETPLSRLAETLVMDRTSLYRALQPMIREGWIVARDAARGRSKIAVMTHRGRQAMDAATAAWEGAQVRFVGAVGPELWEMLGGALQGLSATAAKV
jgi:DNA-binding MarR family transcriptional regulator